MISFLRGRIAERTATQVVVDVGGVGFACGVSSTTAAALPAPGSPEEAVVYTKMSVREDAMSLYGFSTREERAAFESLVSISGVGPKLALSVLSTFGPAALKEVVSTSDEKRMATVPGVGKKTAQRMILELRDAFKTFVIDPTQALPGFEAPGLGSGPAPSAVEDATQALLSMGFAPAEAEVALKGYDGAPDDVEAAVKYALKRLGSVS